MKLFKKLYWIVILAAMTSLTQACKEAVETIEVKNEEGVVIEKFQVLKENGKKHGEYKSFDEEGKIIESANFKKGLPEGKRIIYYPNGNPQEEENYENGFLVGDVISYYETGEVKARTPYIIKEGRNVLEGVIRTYYKNGQLVSEAEAKANEINGAFTEYYENGNIKAKGTQVTDDFLGEVDHGRLEKYNEQGELVAVMDCNMGRCTTVEDE